MTLAPGLVAAVSAIIRGWPLALLTYSVHAAIWTLGASSVVRRLAPSGVPVGAAQHRLWRLSLVGALATSAVAVSGLSALVFAAAGVADASWPHGASWTLGVTNPFAEAAVGRGGPSPAVSSPLVFLIGMALLFASFAGLAWWVAAAVGQSSKLAGRRSVRDGRVRERFGFLLGRANRRDVRLTESPRTHAPLALGRREICLPSSLAARLEDEELDGVLAHELAHLERRDGLWFPAFALLRAVFWFHPVVRWAVAEAVRTAEVAADDRAAALTGDPLGLARALTRVAADVAGIGPAWLPSMTGATPMKVGSLRFRVRRLVDAHTAGVTAASAEDSRAAPIVEAAKKSTVGVALCLVGLGLLSLAVPLRAPAFRFRAPGWSRPMATGALPEDSHELARTMDDLAREEGALRATLSAALGPATSTTAEADEGPYLQQLRQDLRHVHAMQGWIEQRLLRASQPRVPVQRPPE